MIYELRFYSVTQGRMRDVHDRFNRYLPSLFERHGVNCVARWWVLAGPQAPRFVYLLAYQDYGHRELAWDGFYKDEAWWRVRAQTNAGHEMVETYDLAFLKPSAVWQIDPTPEEVVGGVHEMVIQQVAPGQNAVANAFLTDTWLPALRESGARVLGVFDMAAGVGMPAMVLFLAWPDAATWHAGHLRVEDDAKVQQALHSQRQSKGSPALLRAEVHLLQPAPGMVIRAALGRQV